MTRGYLGSSRRSERGQAMVEFALVLPLLLVLAFGIMDFGRALQAYVTINNAAREGARTGSITPSTGTIQNTVRDSAGDFGDDVDINVSYPDGNESGGSVRVRVEYDYTMITPLGSMIGLASGGALDESFALRATSDMRIE
ncbi:MAG: pilus assembly protein [Dehalococcoidia bacterium]|nr:pilus assembly protein [Dehalococcoidia bacterium]